MDELLALWTIGVVDRLRDALVLLHTLLVGLGLGDVPILGDLTWGLTIIGFTVAIKLITIPLTAKQLHSSKAMQALQPQLKELQRKHGKDRERLMQEQMRLYKENKINPAAGCLPLLIQMPIWFGLYQALFDLANKAGQYGFEGRFLWVGSLAQPEGFPQVLAVLTGVTQWIVQRMMTPTSSDPTQKTMNQMMQFMPIMFVFFAFSVPSGLVLYWVTSNVFSMIQQYFVMGWGSLFPLPFMSNKASASASREVTMPSTNGSRPVEDKQTGGVVDAPEAGRGPGGGKKKRMKRR